MNPVVHFEMPYEDANRAAKFYEQAFGWKTARLPGMDGDYVTLETTRTQDGRPTKPGTINGGLWQKDTAKPAQVPSVVIAVEDIEAAMASVKQAGGEVLGDPVTIPGFGSYVSFMDSENNRVSLLMPQR